MRFEKLLLRAFGPFTDRTLDFAAAAPAGLHLIYGPNEAGKSSALRATVSLLYGIAHRTDDDFVHAHPDMRVGAVIHADDGRRLALMRRKANKHPLRLLDEATGRDDEPAGADALAALTGGMDRELFESMFGIDHVRLREGGRQLLAGEGELGASLFQAGSGLANVRGVLDALDAEARERFVPRGQIPPINETLKRLDELRREQRDRTTRPREWAELAAAVEAARCRDEELAARVQALRDEQRTLTRLRATLPQAARHARLAAGLAELADAPRLPADASEHRLRAEAELARATAAAAEAAREADALQARHDAIRIDAALLAQADPIARLHHDAERAAQVERDRAVRQADAARLAAQIDALLERIDHARPRDEAGRAEAVRQRVLSAVAVAGVREAAARLLAARQDAEGAAARARDAESAAARAQAAVDALPAAPPPMGLAAAHAAAVALGAIDREIAAAQARVGQADARIADGARGLGVADPKRLRAAVPPPVGHAEALAAQLAAGRAERARLRDEARRLAVEIAALQSERARLSAVGEVVTAATLAATRRARDALWRELAGGSDAGAAMSDPADPAASANAPLLPGSTHATASEGARAASSDFPQASAWGDSGATPAAARRLAAFERALREADRQADMLRADADRAARFDAIERDLVDRAERAAEAARRGAQLDEAEAGLIGQWSRRLESTGLPFMEPEAFVRWHERRDAWIGHCAARDDAQATLAERRALRWQAARTLTGALRAEPAPAAAGGPRRPGFDLDRLDGLDGLDDRRADSPLSPLVEAAAARLAVLSRQAETLVNARRALLEALHASTRARAELDDARVRADAAASAWGAAVAPLRLSADAAPLQADARLSELDELRGLQAQWREAHDACVAHQAWLDARRADLDALARALGRAAPLAAQAAAFVATLQAAALAAQEDRRQQQALVERIAALRERAAREAAAAAEARRALAQLCAAAGTGDLSQLPVVEQRAARRRQLEDELHTLQAQLIQAADRPLQALLQEAAARDPDEVARRMEQVSVEIERAEPEARAAQQALVDARHRLGLVDGSDAAAAARESVESALARLRNDALAYARARMAHALLEQALAAYQERAQGPMIEHATRLFAAITGGRYVRLRAVDDGDRRVLVAERDDGAARRIEQLSEGTRDVLYLALRLAALHLHLDGNPPMPLVLDDVLLTFDDARAAATLAALAELSRRTQVLLFTHHEHLLEVAARAVQARDLAVHRLH